jgi:hypothetical protein
MAHKTVHELLNEIVDTNIHGLRLARPTGEVLDEDTTYIEVMIGGKSVYVKPSMPFGWFAVPGKKWWAENKDKWGVWVMPEMNNPAHYVWIGMCPLDEQKPENSAYPESWELKTRNWTLLFDDEENSVTLSSVSGGEKLKVEPGKITLGAGNEKMVLGDQLVSLLGQMVDILAAATIPTQTGGIGTFDPGVIANLQALKAQFESAKSQTITIE